MASEEKNIASALPVTYKEFKKSPIIGLLYICLVAIASLYIRAEVINNNNMKDKSRTIQMLTDKTDRLSTEVSFLREQVRRSDSALADVRATLKVLKEYQVIK